MISMDVNLDGDNAWPDINRDKLVHSHVAGLAVLKDGMSSGRPSVALRIELPDGRTLIAETSARLYCSAARAIMARYPNLFEGD